MDQNLMCAGAITRAHGIRGAVQIKAFTHQAQTILEHKNIYTKDGSCLKILSIAPFKHNLLIAHIESIKDRNQAELMRGTEIFIKRDALPMLEDEQYYYADLVGLKVLAGTDKEVATVCAVHNYGAGDFLEISLPTQERICIPFRKECVTKICLPERYLVIDPSTSLTDTDYQKVMQ